jgi:rubrerythrin
MFLGRFCVVGFLVIFTLSFGNSTHQRVKRNRVIASRCSRAANRRSDNAMSMTEQTAGYRCQFCGKVSPAKDWKDDKCPKCGREYDPILAQDCEEND